MTYSVDFRSHVLSIKKKEGLTFEQTAMRFTVGIASLTRWNKTIIPKATRENRPRKVDLKALAKDVETHPDAYQYERALRFGVHPKSIWNGLRKRYWGRRFWARGYFSTTSGNVTDAIIEHYLELHSPK